MKRGRTGECRVCGARVLLVVGRYARNGAVRIGTHPDKQASPQRPRNCPGTGKPPR